MSRELPSNNPDRPPVVLPEPREGVAMDRLRGNQLEFQDGLVAGEPASFLPTEATSSTSELAPQGRMRRFLGHLAAFGGAIKSDYKEHDHKERLIAGGALAIGSQVMDRLRVAVVLVPNVAIPVLTHTHNAIETGAAAGAVFGAWCYSVGETWLLGMNQFPKAVDSVQENFPKAVEVVSKSLPGREEFDTKPESRKEFIEQHLGAKALSTHISRGFTAIGLGTTAYVGTTKVKGQPNRVARMINAVTSLDGGLVLGGIIGGIAETIIKIGESHPALAQRIENDAKNQWFWYGLAGLMIAGEVVSNKLAARKERKQASTQEEQEAFPNLASGEEQA